MPVQFISHHYCNNLGNPGEKQVGMKRFFILRFTHRQHRSCPWNGWLISQHLSWSYRWNSIRPCHGAYQDRRAGFSRDKYKTSCRRGILYRDFHSGRRVCFYRLFYHIPISLSGIQTSRLAARSGEGICILPVSLEGMCLWGSRGCRPIQQAVEFRKGDSAVEGNVSFLKGSFLCINAMADRFGQVNKMIEHGL